MKEKKYKIEAGKPTGSCLNYYSIEHQSSDSRLQVK